VRSGHPDGPGGGDHGTVDTFFVMPCEEVVDAVNGICVVSRCQGLDGAQSRIAKNRKAGLCAADVRKQASTHDTACFA
jgi:hypothetical protein